MKELVEIIAKALVDNPDEVVVTETEKDKAIIVDLKVAPSDMGKVIGKSGRIAKSIRSVVSAAASRPPICVTITAGLMRFAAVSSRDSIISAVLPPVVPITCVEL